MITLTKRHIKSKTAIQAYFLYIHVSCKAHLDKYLKIYKFGQLNFGIAISTCFFIFEECKQEKMLICAFICHLKQALQCI
jgi:hypothetical protein